MGHIPALCPDRHTDGASPERHDSSFAPGLAAMAIYVFISSTNEFLFAMIFASTYKSKTVPVALADMVGKYQIRYGDMTAGGVKG